MPDPEQAKFLVIGRILGSFALSGELLVEVVTDFPERFAGLQSVHVGERLRPFKLEGSRPHRNHVVVKLAGVDTADAAGNLRGQLLQVPLAEAVPLPPDQYYWHQIIGLEVWTSEHELLGRVVDILRTGANDVYIVRGPRGEVLIPAIEDAVKEIDVAAGTMVVELLPGIL